MTSRPKIGQFVTATDRLLRTYRHERESRSSRKWERAGEYAEPVLKARPVEGHYVGRRTYSNGFAEWDYDYGYIYYPTEHFEVWLIAPNDRQNGVPCLPEDCTIQA